MPQGPIIIVVVACSDRHVTAINSIVSVCVCERFDLRVASGIWGLKLGASINEFPNLSPSRSPIRLTQVPSGILPTLCSVSLSL